jgi:anti-sigma regulatory factor (Ser/Thr protein kinase)
MKTRTAPVRRPTVHAFRHEALLYQGTPGFLDAVLPFIQEGVEGGETVLVAVDPAKIELLRQELNGTGDRVRFADMLELGHNPGRIIPAWRDFVAEHAAGGRAVRGIGEPIWAGRTGAELAECHLHESLLNMAFDGGPAWLLTCPYDVDSLEPEVVEEARRTHPFVRAGHASERSRTYPGSVPNGFDRPFPEPAGPVEQMSYDTALLADLRDLVSRRGQEAGLSPTRTLELTMAVNEVATNSVRYGGGAGTFRLWREAGVIIVEVRDAGVIRDPLVGRATPDADQEGGRGLWLVNQFCDLVQVRSLPDGVRVRLHMALPFARA